MEAVHAGKPVDRIFGAVPGTQHLCGKIPYIRDAETADYKRNRKSGSVRIVGIKARDVYKRQTYHKYIFYGHLLILYSSTYAGICLHV